jgi:branched-chain amino acid aminotransferase
MQSAFSSSPGSSDSQKGSTSGDKPPAGYRMLVNVGGAVSPWSQARVSAMDHGFLYGDSVYETVRSYGGTLFLMDRHLDRLQRSLDRVFIPLPISRKELLAQIEETIRAYREAYRTQEEVAVRAVVTRGAGPIGLDFALCEKSSYLIYVFELPRFGPSLYEAGITVVISKIRRNHPRALDPGIKSGNFLNNILAFKDAKDAGAHEAIICNADGYLAEGTTSNVFVVKDGLVWTPHPYGILDGITRAVVFEEARAAGIAIGETNIPPEALFSANEAFITSSLKAVLGIQKVNGRPVGEGRPGPVTRRLLDLYHQRVDRECRRARSPAGSPTLG